MMVVRTIHFLYFKSFAKSDSRFVVYSQNNQGVAIARNRGIKEAQGEYIRFSRYR